MEKKRWNIHIRILRPYEEHLKQGLTNVFFGYFVKRGNEWGF